MLNSEETLAQKFVKKGFWLYLFTFLIGPIGYFIKIIISHDLSVGEVGMIYGVLSFVTLLSAFNDLGCTESLNYFLPKYIIKNEYGKAKYLLRLTIMMQICSSILIAGILYIVAPWLASSYFNEALIVDIIRIAGLYFIGINFFHITTVLFSVSQNTKLQKGSDFIKLIATLIATGLLVFMDQGTLSNYMWAWLLGIFIGFIFSAYFAYTKYYKIYFKGISIEPIPEDRNLFFKYAFATLLTANIATMLSQVDMQMIIVMLGSEATGYYSNYLSLLNIPFIFISPIIGFLFPVISELNGRNDTQKMKIIHKEFSLYFSLIGIWLSAFLFQFGEPLSILFFGEKFRASGSILAFSAFFLTFILLVQINFQFLAGTGKVKERAKILGIVLPINIILNYIFISLYGVGGSALAVGLSWIPLWYLTYKATEMYHGNFDWGSIGKNILLILVCSGLLYYLTSIWGFNDTSKGGAFFIILIAMGINIIIFGTGNLPIIKNAWNIIKNNR